MKFQHRNIFNDERGVAMIFGAIALSSLLVLFGLAVDLGLVYYAKERLNESVRLAALEGAGALNPLTGSSTYSNAAKTVIDHNASSTRVMTMKSTPTITKECTQTVQALASLSTTAINCNSGNTTKCCGIDQANAVTVSQTATVNLYLLKYLMGSMDITATARAGANIGGLPPKMNIMIVLDATPSMTSTDTACKDPADKTGKTNLTKIKCALLGINNILSQLNPAYQQVGLIVFPPFSNTSNVASNYCSGTGGASYALYGSTSPKYTIFSVTSDNSGAQTGYSSVNGTTGQNELVPSSNWGQLLGKGGCSGLAAEPMPKRGDPTGCSSPTAYTYFADAITTAQQILHAANPDPSASGIQNVMFFVSDGDANESCAQKMPANKNTDECTQAVTAATAAKQAGTLVYSLGYAVQSGGCSTDGGAITACKTMEKIASSNQTFYTDAASQCGSTGQSIPNMAQGFAQGIGKTIKPRLIPVKSVCPSCN